LSLAPGQIGRRGARSLVFRILTAASDFLVVFVTARGFGAEGRGLYALASLTALIIVTLAGGTATALSADLARGRASVSQLRSASLALAGGLAVPFALAIAVAVAIGWPHDPAILIGAGAAPLIFLTELQIAMYQAQGDPRRMHYVQFAKSFIALVALAVVAVAAPGHTYLALAVWAVVQLLVPATTLYLQHRHLPLTRRGLSPLLRRLLRGGAPVSLANGIVLLNFRIDLIVVAVLLPLKDFGRYSVAVATGETLFLVSRALVTGSFAPVASSDFAESERLTARVVRHTWLPLIGSGLMLSVVMLVLGGPVLGDAFKDTWIYLVILLPGIVAFGVTEILRVFFLVRLERSRQVLVMAGAGTFLNLALALALVPSLKLVGAALSTTISYVAGATYLLFEFGRVTRKRSLRNYLPGGGEMRDYRVVARSLMNSARGALRPRRAQAGAPPLVTEEKER
jgi:O-antigen/teichoic acid export membrane protein